ncbi:hypothetical protein N7456_008819 [Penicillium angulare]|uniref:Ribosomal RNA methyltransferase FtsJ domain-containing protein n=1 Tax=Penicillium angulare TaxID=116970 RepID=A0A9W9F3E0_9EURO|nr:hypothetical protein N7456_008819 [Penicillium angulare]
MMKSLGDQLQKRMKLIPAVSQRTDFEVLDLCMAPGGFSSTVLKHNPMAKVFGISLAESEGGNTVLLRNWQEDTRVDIKFMDITMLSTDLGFPEFALQDHPSASKFSDTIPYEGHSFDLAFCDGQVISPEKQGQDMKHAATRLICAQLILALQRIKTGGTFVVLLHQTYRPQVVRLMEAFSHFSKVILSKPYPYHAKRSSFYLVAKDIDPQHERACRLLRDLKNSWGACTAEAFGFEFWQDAVEEPATGDHVEDMSEILDSFGEKLVSLAKPAWKIQKEALEKQFLSNGL